MKITAVRYVVVGMALLCQGYPGSVFAAEGQEKAAGEKLPTVDEVLQKMKEKWAGMKSFEMESK